MDIEYPPGGKFSQLGHSIRSAIQNDSFPIVDILVREAIQNSLDAAQRDQRKVFVDFKTGCFDYLSLNEFFPQIKDALNNDFRDKENRFLAIKDGNTVGLTGQTNSDGFVIADDDNFFKLVYGINKEQQKEGAGGAWGLGKTVFFKAGIGLVLYYSRIKVDDFSYESRFAASFIEDERQEKRYIDHPSGIAWWGKRINPKVDETQPITDELFIKNIEASSTCVEAFRQPC